MSIHKKKTTNVRTIIKKRIWWKCKIQCIKNSKEMEFLTKILQDIQVISNSKQYINIYDEMELTAIIYENKTVFACRSIHFQ